MNIGGNMKEEVTLKSLEQIKVFANALRVRLLEAFSDKPRTAKQVADLLGQQPTKLYHHVDALERVGLIKLVKTQKKRGTLEKYYRTVANRFLVDKKLFQIKRHGKEVLGEFQTVFAAMLENTLSEVNQSITQRLIKPAKKECEVTVARTHIRTTQDQIDKLRQKIQKLLNEFQIAKKKRGETEYGLTLVFYPVVKKKKAR
jgi:DNA-binding transcriptional ArsR family regulator